MFRSLRLYRLEGDWPRSEADLSAALQTAAFKPCGPVSEISSGWEAVAEGSEALCRRVLGADLMRLRTQTRLLPPAVIAEAMEERLRSFRERTGEEPGRRQRRRLKAQTRDELLPKAMLKSRRSNGVCLLKENILGVEAGSASAAERFLEHLRLALGELKAKPLAFKRPLAELMVELLHGGGPAALAVGQECRLRDPADPAASVRWADMDLESAVLKRLMQEGMQPTRLAVNFSDRVQLVIDENAVMSKIRLQGEEAELQEEGDPLARLDARFALAAGTLRDLLGVLERALGGYA